MTIYIAGPMTGIKDLNRPTFNAVAAALRTFGFEVVNPVELCPPGMAWTDCMRRDIAAMMGCDSVALLPGWMNSKGARLERQIAVQLGMHVYDIGALIEDAGHPNVLSVWADDHSKYPTYNDIESFIKRDLVGDAVGMAKALKAQRDDFTRGTRLTNHRFQP